MYFNHKCHFHTHQAITKFCPKKQCTLPLCPECEPIHLEEHKAQYQHAQLLRFNEAYEQAAHELEGFLDNERKMLREVERQLQNDREAVLRTIDAHYASYHKAIQTTKGKCHQVSEKLNKLKKGSIKTLIFFYSGQIELATERIDFEPLIDRLTKKVRDQHPQLHPQLYSTKYDPYPLSQEKNKKQVSSTTKFDNQNVFHSIEEIRLGDKNKQKARKSIFEPSKRLEAPVEPDRRSPANKYNYNINPTVENQEQINPNKGSNCSPKLHKNYENLKIDIRERPASSSAKPETPVSFENRYKFTQNYEDYKKQKDERSNKGSKVEETRSKKEKDSNKVLRPSDLQLNLPTDPNVLKPSNSQTPQTSQRLRCFSQNTLPMHVAQHENTGYDMKKQVLPPEQIRKMLEKRMEERNRILSIKKADNYNGGSTELQGTKKGWQTRDSIINQIYHQTKN